MQSPLATAQMRLYEQYLRLTRGTNNCAKELKTLVDFAWTAMPPPMPFPSQNAASGGQQQPAFSEGAATSNKIFPQQQMPFA